MIAMVNDKKVKEIKKNLEKLGKDFESIFTKIDKIKDEELRNTVSTIFLGIFCRVGYTSAAEAIGSIESIKFTLLNDNLTDINLTNIKSEIDKETNKIKNYIG